MTPDEAVDAMSARLSAVEWESHGNKGWSKAALMKEYLRRAARWAAAYSCKTPEPFFDIAQCVDDKIRAQQEAVESLVRTVSWKGGGRNVVHVVPFILHWTALRATPDLEFHLDLEDPFEPLILLFERDGGFYTEHGFIDLEMVSIRMAGWRNRAEDPPMPSFAPEALDEIDRAGSMAAFGEVIDPL